MIAAKGTGFDVILVSGEPYADHPLSPVGMIARVLDAEGLQSRRHRAARTGRRRTTSSRSAGRGSSSASPRARSTACSSTTRRSSGSGPVDPNAPFQSRMPDRAVIVYANRIRELHKGARIVLGGIEASLRRFAHYDYWGDDVRRSILLDTRADILVYGPGELQVVEIARRLDRGEDLDGIRGTCDRPAPRHRRAPWSSPRSKRSWPTRTSSARPRSACTNRQDDRPEARQPLRRPVPGARTTRRPTSTASTACPSPAASPRASRSSAWPASRSRPIAGCVGRCSFCSLSLHQGDRIVSRSERVHPRGDPAHDEASRVARASSTTSAVRRPTCTAWTRRGSKQPPHRRLIGPSMRAVRKVPGRQEGLRPQRHPLRPGPREPRVRPGARPPSCFRPAQDRARARLADKVLRLMNKSGGRRRLDEFRKTFVEARRAVGGRRPERREPAPAPQHLKYYFMVAHPGTTEKEARELADFLRELERSGEKPVEGVQIFTPTPMTRSTCMYHTGLDPDHRRSGLRPPALRREEGPEADARQRRERLSARRPEKRRKRRDQVFASPGRNWRLRRPGPFISG